MLTVENLSVQYGQHVALSKVSLRVEQGEIAVILGANGAGKSTLLRAIGGICNGSVSGDVHVDGERISGLAADDIVEKGIALVPEGRGIFGDLSVRDNLLLGAYPRRARDSESENLLQVCTLFPRLEERMKQTARTMSGGEQQMVAIGRAMMSAPRVLMLDEPSLGLSPLLCKELFANLSRVRDAGIGILLVEQNAKQSLAIADRGYLLENAQIVHEDTAANLANDSVVQSAYLGATAGPAKRAGKPQDQLGSTRLEHEREIARPKDVPFIDVVETRRGYATADDLLGSSIQHLVAAASASSQREVPSAFATKHALPPDHDQRLQNLLDGLAAAAKQASQRTRTLDTTADTENRHETETETAREQRTPVVEVYRAPRVEVYRRRPGSNQLERQ
ncbi:MAG: ABC transporter ATP-binding protein [Pseudomonadota bacterium]